MSSGKCAFSAPLIAGKFGCKHAEATATRNGPDISCRSADSAARCAALLVELKNIALPAFGVEDDPLSMPHSTLVKIESGGLLGLQHQLSSEAPEATRVENIDGLVQRVWARYPNFAALPAAEISAAILAYKPRRR